MNSAHSPVLSLQEKLYSINTALSAEYECRRRMLIKRLDVTVQSFGWSDKAKASFPGVKPYGAFSKHASL